MGHNVPLVAFVTANEVMGRQECVVADALRARSLARSHVVRQQVQVPYQTPGPRGGQDEQQFWLDR